MSIEFPNTQHDDPTTYTTYSHTIQQGENLLFSPVELTPPPHYYFF